MAQSNSLRSWPQIADAMRRGGETSAFIAKARKAYGEMVPSGPLRVGYLGDLYKSPKGVPYQPEELLTKIKELPPEEQSVVKQSYLKDLSRAGATGEEIGEISKAFFPKKPTPVLPQTRDEWESLLFVQLAAFEAGGLAGPSLGLVSGLGRGMARLGARPLETGMVKKVLPSLASRMAGKNAGVLALRAMREKGPMAAR